MINSPKFQILLSVVATSYAGVGVVTPQIEAEAYRLWNKFCEDGSDGGMGEGLAVFCKRPRGIKKQSLQHNIELPKGSGDEQQIVFVQVI